MDGQYQDPTILKELKKQTASDPAKFVNSPEYLFKESFDEEETITVEVELVHVSIGHKKTFIVFEMIVDDDVKILDTPQHHVYRVWGGQGAVHGQ